MRGYFYFSSMNIIPLQKEQLSIVAELAYEIWPTAYKEILSPEQLQYMLAQFYSIEALEAQQAGRVTVYVRGAPVINDATRDDAIAAGITKLVPVFDNGSDAPGTLLEDCSAEFRAAFEHADMIIAKGQGNYESLSDSTRPVHFLFVVKCPVIAAQVGAPVGTLVISQTSAKK